MGKIILAIAAILVGLVGTLLILTTYVAGAANMKPEQLAVHYRWMGGFGILGAVSLLGGIALLWLGRPGWAAIVGAVPIGVVLVAVVYLFVDQVFR